MGAAMMLRREMSLADIRQHDRREEVLRRRGRIAALVQSRQVWRANGSWHRFYAVAGGAVHASPTCSTLTDTTEVVALWRLSGASPEVVAHDHRMCRRCWGDVVPAGRVVAAGGCPGSGQMGRCRCGGRGCRQACPVCGVEVLITPSGVLRRHG